jgi:hypothetical protein
MLLESLKPLQAKYNVLANATGVAANSLTVNIPNNPRRRSLIFIFGATANITIAGNARLTAAPNSTTNSMSIYKWDDMGDALNLITSITSGAAESYFIVIETYREEVPLDQ